MLVHEFQRSVADRHANFLSGKFDQLKRDVPYAPLLHCFSDFVRQLLTMSEEELDRWRQRLREGLGENGQIVIEVIPLLEQIIGRQPPVLEMSPQEAQIRFNLTLQRFVSLLASEGHPLVLFLDDLQWADLPSLQLLQLLLTQPHFRHLLIVGAYREDEVGGGHPLRLMLGALKEAGTPITSVFLEPLEFNHVVQLTADTLRCAPERAAPLSRLLLERSGGNPFFIGQLLRMLYEDRLIDFSPDTAKWEWDVEVIRAHGVTDNVIELMTRKLQRLPEATQRVLQLAASIGNRFQLALLSIVHGRSPAATASELYPAIEEGLLLPLDERWRLAEHEGATDATYRFLHDRVQQAAYSLIPEDARAELHLRIARAWLASMSPAQLEEQIIDLVHQLNRGCSLVTQEEERYEVARLNLQAGRKAKASAAFEPALRYFTTGLEILPKNAWLWKYSLCLGLHLEAMEAEYLNAHTDRGEALSEFVLSMARDPVEKAQVYNIRIAFASIRKDLKRALEDGYTALELLGLKLPRSVELAQTLELRNSIQELLPGQNIQSILNLPPMSNPRWLAACQVAARLIAPAFINHALTGWAITMEMMKLCLLHGNAREAPFFYVGYGAFLSAIVGDVDTAMAYADVSLVLLDQLGAKHLKAKVHNSRTAYVLHWKRHLRETFAPLEEGVQVALDTGDLEAMGYLAGHLIINAFFAGQPLDEVIQQSVHYLELTTRWKLEHGSHIISSIRLTCFNLMGRSTARQYMLGELFAEDTDMDLSKLHAVGHPGISARIYLLKTLLACFSRDTALAVAMAEAGEAYLDTLVGSVLHVQRNFFQSLALLSAYNGASELDKARYLAKVERNQEFMSGWAAHAPMNSLHRYQLVEAERARISGDFLTAARLYEEAAVGASRQRYLNEEALCHELAGEFFLSIGRERIAHDSLLDAAAAYRRWGAEAKVADLERRYPEAFARARARAEDSASLATTSSSTEVEGDRLDLATVIKAAHTLSGEIVLDRLLDRLMRSAIENAGAQRGLLILTREGRWVIEAERQVHSAASARLPVPLEGSSLLSAAIVHFVMRTQESVVLDDASSMGLFTRDPYVLEHRLRSVLCAPLINQGKLVAIIYLENNHSTGAFTAGRLEVLRLLSAQAALSIHNALLYSQLEEYNRTLEQRVKERTHELQVKNQQLDQMMRQLRTTQKQLVVQEKLASLGVLMAGIAHELKNPLNFIANFAELTTELTEELAEGMASLPSQRHTEALRQGLTQIQQNVSKISEHGFRANQIINGMLMHSRELSNARVPADLNTVLRESIALAYQQFRTRYPTFEMNIQVSHDPAVGEVDMAPSEITRVLINAVDNACYSLFLKKNASREGFSPRLEVSTRGRGEMVEVRIRDNGTGIPEALLGKVFNPFFTTKPAGEGTGLGLSLSHDIIVEGHQGTLRMESVEAEFAELIIELPRRASAT
jgi:predicted ATPase/signal transduction histidine kinase